MAVTVEKFWFERSFDPEALEAERREQLEAEQRRREAEEEAARRAMANEPEPEPEPPAPVFSEEELEAARREAYDHGLAAGEEAARHSKEEALNALLKAVMAETMDIAGRQAKANDGLGDTAIQVALAVCTKMLPTLMERHGTDEIEAVIRQCLGDLMDEPRIVVRVSDDILDDIRDRVDRITAETGYAGAFVLLADAALAPGDCRVEWADGGAERLGNQVWRDVEGVISRLQAADLPPTGIRPESGDLKSEKPVNGNQENVDAAGPQHAATQQAAERPIEE
jgi:flagellar assembly protein FliH